MNLFNELGQFLEPYAPKNPVMALMWLGCLQWAIKEPGCLEEFRAATGQTWTPGKSPLAQMIDQATGVDKAFLEAFVAWFNVHVWGKSDDAPPPHP